MEITIAGLNNVGIVVLEFTTARETLVVFHPLQIGLIADNAEGAFQFLADHVEEAVFFQVATAPGCAIMKVDAIGPGAAAVPGFAHAQIVSFHRITVRHQQPMPLAQRHTANSGAGVGQSGGDQRRPFDTAVVGITAVEHARVVVALVAEESGGAVRTVHQHQRLNRFAAMADAGLVLNPVILIQTQHLTEFADHLMIDRQPNRAIGESQRRRLHQRADVEEGRSGQGPIKLPGCALIPGFQHHHTAGGPATEAYRHHEQAHAAVIVENWHRITQLAHMAAPALADLIPADHGGFFTPDTGAGIKNGGVNAHILGSLPAAGEPEGTQTAIRQLHHGSGVDQSGFRIGGETHLPLPIDHIVRGNVFGYKGRIGLQRMPRQTRQESRYQQGAHPPMHPFVQGHVDRLLLFV